MLYDGVAAIANIDAWCGAKRWAGHIERYCPLGKAHQNVEAGKRLSCG